MKRALVVGASSGMGRAVAERLAMEGYRVMVTARREDLLKTLQGKFPEKILTSSFDVTDLSHLHERLENAVHELGGIDLFFISAGGGDLNEGLEFSTDKKMIDLNVGAFTSMVGWAFNYFRNQGNGHLAAITSIAGLRGLRHSPGYNASKAYQINYLEGLRQKAWNLKLDITVTDIRPGFVDTPNAKGEGRFWQAPVPKAADQIMLALRKRKKVAYISRRWRFVAAVMKFVPGSWYERL